MPAKYIKRVDVEKGYFHIFNRGVSGKIIFRDERDYEVFLKFLKDYLTPLAHPDTYKKDFTVKGRTFRGAPHKTKNYFNEINLIAYNLMPDHFHLLLQQISKGSLEEFMRSLCTRYSMYFNKNYQCSGPLFEGPYKSVYLDDVSSLLHLTRYLHRHPEVNDSNLADQCSSYPEYLGKRETSWVKSNVVLSAIKGVEEYKNFVEKYEPDRKDEKLLEGIILEKKSERLEGSNLQLAGSSPSAKPVSKIPFFIVASAIFVFLFALGLRNVLSYSTKDIISINTVSSPSPTPVVAGVKDEKSKIILAVKINDGAESVNIRMEPSTQSTKIGEAKDGDIFEFVSINSGWYEVKLTDGSVGFISSKYIEIIEEPKI